MIPVRIARDRTLARSSPFNKHMILLVSPPGFEPETY